VTSQGYPAASGRSRRAPGSSCQPRFRRGVARCSNGGHGCRAASRAGTTGDTVFRCRRGVAGQKAQGGNAAALKCNGAPGPEKQDKREESANG